MGVPFLYRWIAENKRFKFVKRNSLPGQVYSLSFDLNGMIHSVAQIVYSYGKHYDEKRVSAMKKMAPEAIDAQFAHVFETKFREAIEGINPTEVLIITVDGRAPMAKIQQQRQRRFRAAKSVHLNPIFDPNCITPGTQFMIKVDGLIKQFIAKYRTTIIPPRVIYSPHNAPGEGEHKIMDIFRDMATLVTAPVVSTGNQISLSTAIQALKIPKVSKYAANRGCVDGSPTKIPPTAEPEEKAAIERVIGTTKIGDTKDYKQYTLDSVQRNVTPDNKDHQLKYRSFKEAKEQRCSLELGQRKLFLSELDFLTLVAPYINPADPVNMEATIVYAGAAGGHHIPYIMKMFPKTKWHLYDPSPFTIQADGQRLFIYSKDPTGVNKEDGFFTDEVAKSWKGRATIFLSDIRREPDQSLVKSDPERYKVEFENNVKSNMNDQARWVQLMIPDVGKGELFSMLKFRLPHYKGTTQYFKGTLRVQAYPPQASTECRLITVGREIQDYHQKDNEDWFYYHNMVVRQWQKYAHNVTARGLNHCADCALEIVIHRDYLSLGKRITNEAEVGKAIDDLTNYLNSFGLPGLHDQIKGSVKPETKSVPKVVEVKQGIIPREAVHAVYGLDADLIMLSLLSPLENIFLVREDLGDIISISDLRRELKALMVQDDKSTGSEINDFVLMMNLVGNDFLPHSPALSNMPQSINEMTRVYRELGLSLTSGEDDINWSNFTAFLSQMAKLEPAMLVNLGALNTKYPSKIMQLAYESTPGVLTTRSGDISSLIGRGSFGGGMISEGKFNYTVYRNAWYSNAFETKGDNEAKARVNTLLQIVSLFVPGSNIVPQVSFVELKTTDKDKLITDLSRDYLTAISFVYRYYKRGTDSIDMTYYYPHHYAPMMFDLFTAALNGRQIVVPVARSGAIKFDMLDQLLCVLPVKSIELLPLEYRQLMKFNQYAMSGSPIMDLFPDDFIIDRDGTNEDWQGVALLPFADISRIHMVSSMIAQSTSDNRLAFADSIDNLYNLSDDQRAVILSQRQLLLDKAELSKSRSTHGFSTRGTFSGRGRGGYTPRDDKPVGEGKANAVVTSEINIPLYIPGLAAGVNPMMYLTPLVDTGDNFAGRGRGNADRGTYRGRGAASGERGTYRGRGTASGDRGTYRGRGTASGERGTYRGRGRGERGTSRGRGRGSGERGRGN